MIRFHIGIYSKSCGKYINTNNGCNYVLSAQRSKFIKTTCLACLITSIGTFFASAAQAQEPNRPAPTHQNHSYGKHERQILDFWQAESKEPTPLVIYIHGGGFHSGAKNGIDWRILKQLLDARISVAALNYRLLKHAPLPAAHHDCRQAIQFLRSKANAWNIDKARIAAYGNSAGAQLCMWLAFHDDMADSKSEDPLQRESSRLCCVATHGGQTSMDPRWWEKNIPGYRWHSRSPKIYYGTNNKGQILKIVKDISALSLISKTDPPIWMSYKMKPDDPVPNKPGRTRGWQVHHVSFGLALKKEMDALGIESDLHYPGAKTKYGSMGQFFIKQLHQD